MRRQRDRRRGEQPRVRVDKTRRRTGNHRKHGAQKNPGSDVKAKLVSVRSGYSRKSDLSFECPDRPLTTSARRHSGHGNQAEELMAQDVRTALEMIHPADGPR